MRSVITTNVTVTTLNNEVRTMVAGVVTLRAASHQLRLYAAPARQRWTQDDDGDQPFTGKQKPGCLGPMPGCSEPISRCSSRASSLHSRAAQCGRPRVSSCLSRS